MAVSERNFGEFMDYVLLVLSGIFALGLSILTVFEIPFLKSLVVRLVEVQSVLHRWEFVFLSLFMIGGFWLAIMIPASAWGKHIDKF